MHPQSDTQRHYQTGVVSITLETSVRRLRREYADLYARFETPRHKSASIRVEVTREPGRWFRRRRFRVLVNGRLQFEPARRDELLPYVEWAVNWEIARTYPQYLHLHAAAMERDGVGLILPAESGSGKSTLAMGLLRRGWRYLCDEFALVHSQSLLLHPFPRAICLKRGSFSLAEEMNIALPRGDRHHSAKGFVHFVSPFDIATQPVGSVCPVRLVVFPRYQAGGRPELSPMTRGEAALELHRVCFNLFGCKRPGLEVLTRMVTGAECFRLASGELDATCRLLDEVAGRARGWRAATA